MSASSKRRDDQVGYRYHCCICKGSVSHDGPHEHQLDPFALVIVGHADKEWRDQKEQTFYCHFECFRKLVGADGVLYIKNSDFSTNGEAADARAAEEADQISQALPAAELGD